MTLDYWFYVGGPNQTNMEDIVAMHNNESEGLQVNAQYIPGSYMEKLLAALAAGTQPHTMWIAYWDVGALAPNDGIIELDSYVSASPDFADSVEDFYPYLWETSKWRDTLYAIPFDTNNLTWFYNQSLLDAAGITAPMESIDWTQLNEILQALTVDTNGDGAADQWGYQVNSSPRIFNDFMQQAGGSLFNEDATQVTFNSDAGVEALNLYLTWTYAMQTSPNPPLERGFENGLVALEWQGSYRIPVYRELTEVQVGAFPVTHQETRFSGNGGESLVIFKKDAEAHEATWQFIEWMTRPETILQWDTVSGYLPVRQSVADSEEYQALLQEDPIRQVFVDELAYGGRWVPHPKLPQIQDKLRETIESVVLEQSDARTALDAAAAELNELIAEDI
jgi:ABC-type glycerol-3-phosphate transport system substrate-binding protein